MNEMNMHTDMTVKLTQTGAKIVNERNQWFRDNVKGSNAKIDYKEGDEYTAVLWEIMELFGPHCYIGANLPFVEIKPVFKFDSDQKKLMQRLFEEYQKWEEEETKNINNGSGPRGANGGLIGYSLETLMNEVICRLKFEDIKGII